MKIDEIKKKLLQEISERKQKEDSAVAAHDNMWSYHRGWKEALRYTHDMLVSGDF